MSKFILKGIGNHRELISVSSISNIKESGNTCTITVRSMSDEYTTGVPFSMDVVLAFLKSDKITLE